jgi:hypothetical protein
MALIIPQVQFLGLSNTKRLEGYYSSSNKFRVKKEARHVT